MNFSNKKTIEISSGSVNQDRYISIAIRSLQSYKEHHIDQYYDKINKIIKTIKFAKFEDILKNKEICKILLLSLKSWGFTLAELDDVDYMLYSLEKCSK